MLSSFLKCVNKYLNEILFFGKNLILSKSVCLFRSCGTYVLLEKITMKSRKKLINHSFKFNLNFEEKTGRKKEESDKHGLHDCQLLRF